MTEETNDAQGIELMDGTFCTDCYAVFARHEGCKIGIKPLFDMESNRTYIGFRIRAVIEDQDLDFTRGQQIADVFPNFPFKKHSVQRCSLMGGLYVNRGRSNPEDVQDFIAKNRVIGKIISALQEQLGGIEMINEPVLFQFLEEHYNDQIQQHGDFSEQAPMPPAESTVVYMDKAKASLSLDDVVEEAVDPEDQAESEIS